jgi:hypothetical protein
MFLLADPHECRGEGATISISGLGWNWLCFRGLNSLILSAVVQILYFRGSLVMLAFLFLPTLTSQIP